MHSCGTDTTTPAHSDVTPASAFDKFVLQVNTERMRSMLLALGDVRVLLVSFANQLEQARRMESMDSQTRKEFVVATESLYIPIANRLGVWSIKAELEDLCFKVRMLIHTDHCSAWSFLKAFC